MKTLNRTFHKDGTPAKPGQVFVFGSNLQGLHMGGAARAAAVHYGAQAGVAEGPTGQSYAIPTVAVMDVRRLSVQAIGYYVDRFIQHAQTHPEQSFYVTRIGCGIAGFTDQEIAPLFKAAPENCSFAEEWERFL